MKDPYSRAITQSTWQYIRAMPGAKHREIPGGVLMRCRVPLQTLNVAYLDGESETPTEQLERARTFFGYMAWRAIHTGQESAQFDLEAHQVGLHRGVLEPLMVMDPIPVQPLKPPTTATITKRASKGGARGDFRYVHGTVTNTPEWATGFLIPGEPEDDLPGTRTREYVVYDGELPVACAAVTVVGRTAVISNVGTLKAIRRRGFGTFATWAAINAGRALGATTAVLSASGLGEQVYDRMGFRTIGVHRLWERKLGWMKRIHQGSELREMVDQTT